MLNITIVGSGNSGCAHAAYLSSLGHRVTLFKTSNAIHDENFSAICSQKGIFYIDSHKNIDEPIFQPIFRATRKCSEAFSEAEMVIVLTQSLQHEHVADLICEHILHIKMLLIVPGNLGSVFFRKRLPASIMVAEGESTIIDARIEKPGMIRILFHNVRNAVSFNPSCDTTRGFNWLSSNIPNYTHTRSNVVETALHNPNLIVHTVGTIMSAARIEKSKGDFWMYKEGFTPSIWNIIIALDKEKNDTIKAYGGIPCDYIECCKFRNEKSTTIDAKEAFLNYAENGSPKGPDSIHNRYLIEDVPNGLCLLSSLAEKAHIATPVANSLIVLASSLLNIDFSHNCRNMARLGWSKLDIASILSIISNH